MASQSPMLRSASTTRLIRLQKRVRNATTSAGPSGLRQPLTSEGRWRIDRIAREAIRTIYGGASHPEYVGSEFIFVSRTPDAEKQLLAGTHTFKLGRAVLVRGSVVDPEGQPVADAHVLVGHQGESGRRETKTRPDGSFSVSGCKPGESLLTAEAARLCRRRRWQ